MNDSRTEDLFAELAATEDLREYLDVHDFRTLSLSEYLQQELSARGLRQTDVLRRADIGQTFGWYRVQRPARHEPQQRAAPVLRHGFRATPRATSPKLGWRKWAPPEEPARRDHRLLPVARQHLVRSQRHPLRLRRGMLVSASRAYSYSRMGPTLCS